jgi:hypothetical protein
MSMYTVLLCGCGNIGFRHLQALIAMNEAPAQIIIVEPQTALHSRIAGQLAAIETSTVHRFELHEKLPDIKKPVDLAIIATNAAVRRAVYDELASRYQIGSIIFEKVLFQTIKDLTEVGARLERDATKSFVNCGRRGFPGYQSLKQEWVTSRPLDLTVTGSQFGLASNTIHFLDLAEYLNAAQLESVDISGLTPGMLASKREGYVEIFGHIAGRLSNGASISITCEDRAPPSVQVAFSAESLDAQIDEAGRNAIINGTMQPFDSRHVSGMPWIYQELLVKGTTCLTPYADSARQHRIFIEALRGHLGLSNATDDPCPIS